LFTDTLIVLPTMAVAQWPLPAASPRAYALEQAALEIVRRFPERLDGDVPRVMYETAIEDLARLLDADTQREATYVA
jgi:hypothetical protein